MSCSRRSSLPIGLLVLAALCLPACTEVETESATGYEPAKLEEGKGDLVRVTFTREGAERVGLETAPVKRAGGRLSVPYAALLYDPEGGTHVYTSPERLTFLRVPVEVARVGADRVLLTKGPPPGTEVVTVGVAEVYGTELEVPSH